jgi:hypothetical protein
MEMVGRSGKEKMRPHHRVTREDIVDERGDLDWESEVLGCDGVDRQARLRSEQKPDEDGHLYADQCTLRSWAETWHRRIEVWRRITHQFIDHPNHAEEIIIRRQLQLARLVLSD